MSSESVEVVRRQFAAVEQGGVDAMAAYWHVDIAWRAVEGAADDVGPIRGADALRRYYEDWVETLEELSATVEEVLAEAGDRVAVVVRNSGRGRISGALIQGRYYVVCTVRDGRVAAGREYRTREEAVEAVGEPRGGRGA